MPKTPVVSGRDMVRALERLGYVFEGQRGSHCGLRHSVTGVEIIVPVHANRPLSSGTLHTIMKQAGLTPDDLRRLLGHR